MKRTILVEIECEPEYASNGALERDTSRALQSFFPDSDVKILNVEVADGSPLEAFGISEVKP